MPFLFGKQTISQVYTLYKRETQEHVTDLTGSGNDEKENVNIMDNIVSEYRDIDEKIQKQLVQIYRDLTEIPIVLTFEKISILIEQAGLQLYPRLDQTAMFSLIQHSQQVIRKADSSRANPDTTIREEHKIAQDKIDIKIQKWKEELDAERKIGLYASTRAKLKRQIDNAEVERYFIPLDTDQTMTLYRLKLNDKKEKNRIQQIRSRYRKELPNLLPFDSMAKNLLKHLDIINETEECND
ncbi:MAG: hypothetical protein LBJ67_11360 [Planctomycetaceae bacterium]|jgi:hypothetical protein|nr:hypothetical protein [Planctomycetaceae bacterium]